MYSRIVVLGAGYVGITLSVALCATGIRVLVVDIDEKKIDRLKKGDPCIREDGLQELLKKHIDTSCIDFISGDASVAAIDADLLFICLPTDVDISGKPQLDTLINAAHTASEYMASGGSLVVKSTVLPETTFKIAKSIGRRDLNVLVCPEFLQEGTALRDTLNPDRIVIGADNFQAASDLAEILPKNENTEVIITDPTSAELAKMISNTMLASKVTFANLVADIAELTGANSHDVLLAVGADKRIGNTHLRPGPGWGGSCLPKDTQMLSYLTQSIGMPSQFVDSIYSENIDHIERVANRILDLMPQKGSEKLAILGVTFKGGTDDLRRSPAIEVINAVSKKVPNINIYDPSLSSNSAISDFESLVDQRKISIKEDAYKCVESADLAVVLTDWEEFKTLDLALVKAVMGTPVIYDTRNVIDERVASEIGIELIKLGTQNPKRFS
ncbi:MAG: nucleotide sugar dehydrogenase [Acidimicrobiales bacterium]|nr:nucleotide sugar dehydrogenase [Acidimicrobiales bacterium]